MNIAELYSIFLQSKGVNTDTRSITSGQLFFALKGANFNGNTYAIRAIEQGALYAIVDEITEPHTNIIQVADVLETLQALAKYHREQFQIPVLALTGSNGKTTTKELIHAVLSSKYKVIATIGNLNNHIGVPLTLLRIQADTEIAIIEMGANHQKEIASYCTYTLPTHGLITNIGKAHLEGFGGEEGVLKGKTELFDYLNANQKEIFIYTGDDKLMSIATQLHQVKFYGKTVTNQELFVDATIDETADLVKVNYEGISIQTHLVGTYNFPNILASICLGKYFNIDKIAIKQALENYIPDNNRSQIKKIGDNDFILDAYNANPSSMSLAIDNFNTYQATHKMMILGEMKELGIYTAIEHEKIIQQCSYTAISKIIFVGNAFSKFKDSYPSFDYFENALEVKEWFHQQSFSNFTILLKGSRSMGLEKVIS